MSRARAELSVEITRWVRDDQPGWVECRLVDASGRVARFIEKAPVVTEAPIGRDGPYPCAGVIACEIVARSVDAAGREIVTIDTSTPWGVHATTGESRFDVTPSQLAAADTLA